MDYPMKSRIYKNHEQKVGEVEVLMIAELYDDGEEYVVYKQFHKGTNGIISLKLWNETIDMKSDNEMINERPRFYL